LAVLTKLFPGATKEQLANWADRFKTQYGRRVIILKVLATKLKDEKDDEQLAVTEQNIGESLMKMDPPQAADARTISARP